MMLEFCLSFWFYVVLWESFLLISNTYLVNTFHCDVWRSFHATYKNFILFHALLKTLLTEKSFFLFLQGCWILVELVVQDLIKSSFSFVAFWNNCSKKQLFIVSKIILYGTLHCDQYTIYAWYKINFQLLVFFFLSQAHVFPLAYHKYCRYYVWVIPANTIG